MFETKKSVLLYDEATVRPGTHPRYWRTMIDTGTQLPTYREEIFRSIVIGARIFEKFPDGVTQLRPDNVPSVISDSFANLPLPSISDLNLNIQCAWFDKIRMRLISAMNASTNEPHD